MKKELFDALKAKFPGVSDSILDRIATKLAKTATTAEQVKTAVEGVTIQQVIESYGDSRATEASETARKNAVQEYESRYGLKDGVKTTTTTTGGEQPTGGSATNPTTGGTDETPAWARTLIERIERMETAKTTETRTQQLNAVIGKLPEPMRKAYERLPIDKYSAEEFNTLIADITTEVEGIADDTAAQGAVFGKPSASTGAQNKTELTEAQKAAISHREGIPAAGNQPF
ncbi:hypothetical protein [uncultured Duncaniella sp.]|uniref:hypothetical protein n=1 Tax=uncultured Duncaniella sp. TaxID=2768039 RepID=UPI00272CDEBF|nr:hypothetical protein [uncultured Duncaniella sp.]